MCSIKYYPHVEYREHDSKLQIKLPDYIKSVAETDLNEDIIKEISVTGNIINSEIKHFEIKSFYP